jgi:hypothetical protein
MSPAIAIPPPQTTAQIAADTPTGVNEVEYPSIRDWLQYCDRLPRHRGANFSSHTAKFDREGYLWIDQITSKHTTVEKLSEWVGLLKGITDLLIHYATEDVALVKARKFTTAGAHDNEEDI